MKRKLIRQAGQAITITLPIEWIRTNNLNPGDEIELSQNENQLILESDKKTKGKTVTIKTSSEKKRFTYLLVNAAYAKGIDEIKITTDTYPDLNQTMGYAITNQIQNTYTIKDISGTPTQDLGEIFKRVYQMIINFIDSAISKIYSEKNLSKYGREKDIEVNKFILYLQRAITKLTFSEQLIGKIMFSYTYTLETISDEIMRLCRSAEEVPPIKELKPFLEKAHESLTTAFHFFYQSGYGHFNRLSDIRDSTRKQSLSLIKRYPKQAELIMHVQKIIEDSYDLTHLSLMNKI